MASHFHLAYRAFADPALNTTTSEQITISSKIRLYHERTGIRFSHNNRRELDMIGA